MKAAVSGLMETLTFFQQRNSPGWIVPDFIGDTDALGGAGGEPSSPLQLSSNAAAVLLHFGASLREAGIGPFIFHNPMNAVVALQRNVVVGKC